VTKATSIDGAIVLGNNKRQSKHSTSSFISPYGTQHNLLVLAPGREWVVVGGKTRQLN